jgi:hypothetical protein
MATQLTNKIYTVHYGLPMFRGLVEDHINISVSLDMDSRN